MNWTEGTILGLVQGLTEFLPVSSSAHLRVVAALAGWDDPGAAFTAVTQIGTAAAVIVYLRSDIARLGRAWFGSLPLSAGSTGADARGAEAQAADARLAWLIAFGTVPIGACGYLFEDVVKGRLRDLRLMSGALAGVGLLLGAADRWADRRPGARKPLAELSARDGLLIGLAQATALIPGVSRSGATIGGGLVLRYSREAASRFSFLLAVPAVAVSGAFGLHRLYREARQPTSTVAWGPLAGASVVAFLVGYAAIAWFLRYVGGNDFAPFVAYRVGLGLLLLALVLAGRTEAIPAA
ncbi:undecaprenyl-diphosphatase [Parafrankia irregularis]|uniref:Undecaprenyl-diphosphatase n=1 Tax=Parafrankia irregularis TaxID=795642 RepID=A0A0S4QDD1_9ACTN|nr:MULTISPECIES: undecaprenyl-diphosphate phosphatase [Parafrankia]MBE3199810.1 undecaprenyl-diphosphate phosphatase [Parafrankia sp. CH37]CUU53517.1 undecaprenyl-diphosphatase [Parafrankia irregularis]